LFFLLYNAAVVIAYVKKDADVSEDIDNF